LFGCSTLSNCLKFLPALAGILSGLVFLSPVEVVAFPRPFTGVLAVNLDGSSAFSDSASSFVVRGLRIPSFIRALSQTAGRKGKSTYEDEVRLIESERFFGLAVIAIAALVVLLLVGEPLRRKYKKWKRKRSRKHKKETVM